MTGGTAAAPSPVPPPNPVPPPSPAPAHVLALPGTWNARDIGGRAAPAGSTTPLATGVLLRSAALASLEPDGVAALAARGVTTVLDLRSTDEVERNGADVVPVGTRVLTLPFGSPERSGSGDADPAQVLRSLMQGRGGGAGGAPSAAGAPAALGDGAPRDPAALGRAVMDHLYRGFATDPAARAAVARALQTIASAEGPVLVHCSAGKDRTGWVVALVQTVCGVPREAVLAEYLLSAQAATDLAASMPALDGVDPALWEAVLAVHPEYLDAAFDEVERSWGSLDGYLDALGVDAPVRTALRERFGVGPQ